MKQTPLRLATFLALGTAMFSGVNTFIGKIGVTAIKDPLIFTTLKNLVVGVLLIGLWFAWRRWREIKTLSARQWTKLALIGVIGGAIPFALFFTGLSQTSAINGALIHKTLFVWVLLLAIPILKERLSGGQWLGIIMVAAANLFVGGFTGFKYNTGELLILVATILWAVENVIAKIVLKNISSLTVAAVRMIGGSALLAAFILIRGGAGAVFSLSGVQWSWTLLSGLLLGGYVLTWYAALKRAPATYVAVLLVPATLVTNILSAIFVTHALTTVQLINGALLVAGVMMLILFPTRVAKNISTAPVTELTADH